MNKWRDVKYFPLCKEVEPCEENNYIELDIIEDNFKYMAIKCKKNMLSKIDPDKEYWEYYLARVDNDTDGSLIDMDGDNTGYYWSDVTCWKQISEEPYKLNKGTKYAD